MNILTTRPSYWFGDFVSRCKALGGVDVNRIQRIIDETMYHLKNNKSDRVKSAEHQELQTRWYKSLQLGEPDWSVYASQDYLADLYTCWIVYSRKYLLGISKDTATQYGSIVADMKQVRSVADLGCGLGYTTAMLKALFPASVVVGTNFPDILQTRFAQGVGKKYGFGIVDTVNQITAPVDLVFASEYFEHFPAPCDHLGEVLSALQPRYFLVANTFGSESIGHFPYYKVDGQRMNGRQTAKAFAETMRRHGYYKQDTKMWNSRPMYWKRFTKSNAT